MVNACTIIARNYLAHARVLAESFCEQHPRGHFTVLIVDDEQRAFDDSAEPFSCRRLDDLGVDAPEIGRLASIYDVTELSTAVKPLFLRHLLHGSDHVIYLDPDTRVYGSLEKAAQLARQHSLVLTPHLTAPLPRDGRRIDEFHILSSGVYNLGFVGLGSRSEAFIDWWWQKTRRDALVDHNRMMFTDQRWIDFAPGFFEHCILKDPTYNVAYWNLHARDLVWNGDGYRIDGQPLTFFHFSGFDPRKPHLLSKHQADRPRILLSERPGVARICEEYVDSLKRAGWPAESRLPYGWSRLPSGIPFDVRMRRLYRAGLQAHEKGKAPEPPDPFDAGNPDRFLDWLNEPVGGGLKPRVSRYQQSIYDDRPDLQTAFPDLAGSDWTGYANWLRADGVAQFNIPERLLPRDISTTTSDPYTPPSQLSQGVNVAGYFRAELGIGEAARLLAAAVEHAGIPASTLTYAATQSRKDHPFVERGEGRAPYDINILCVNSDRTPDFIRDAGRGLLRGRYTVGLWFWELEYFPPMMHAGFDYVDEVWAATDFVTNAVRSIGRRPVYTIQLPVPVPICSPEITREALGLPPSFMFLFMFDFFSFLERKNPITVIRAFARAFRPDEGPVLVIKAINGTSRLNDLERLRAAAGERRDIRIVDEYYTAEQKNALLGLCDCYVSLHRSEGFGLTMAEAMGLGKPVIATGYSGNLAFMTPQNSFLVNHTKGRVPAECDPYPEGSFWAEPDVDHAASLMRQVYEAPEEAARKARQGQQDVLTKYTVGASAAAVRARLDQIRQTRIPGRPVTATATTALPPARSIHPMLNLLDELSARLTPTASVESSRRFRGPLLAAQRLLFRILRPYWWQQRHVQLSMIAAVQEALLLSVKATIAGPAQREALQAVWNRIDGIVKDGAAIETELADLRRATASTARELADLREAAITFQVNASSHLERLTKAVADADISVKSLEHRLYAPPYVADPAALRVIDPQGRATLGYEAGASLRQDDYAAFEDRFRGSESMIRERQRVYVPLLQEHPRVVDIGCGRGEMLDLLREARVEVIGVDSDPSMVARCRSKGHTVANMDACAFLEAQGDDSLPAIFAAQVVEHMPYEIFRSFLAISRAKLAPGGQLIFETVNPHSLEAYKAFYTDLTHQRPIFPEVAVTLCGLARFERAYVLYPQGAGDLEMDRKTQAEYAVVATKVDAAEPRATRSGASTTAG